MITPKKIIILLIVIIGFTSSSTLFSQDIVYMSNGNLILANNITITPDSIRYSDYNDSTAQVSIPKLLVNSITYEDGSEVEIQIKNRSYNKLNLPTNIISFHLLDFVISNLTFSYERIISNGRIGIQIPLSIGYKDGTSTMIYPIPESPEYTNKLVSKFYSGINLNLYPTGQGKLKYFLGPSVHFGNGLYHEPSISYSSYYAPIETTFSKILLNNGLIYTPTNSLSISVVGAIGIQYMFDSKIKKAETTGQLSLNLSLRF